MFILYINHTQLSKLGKKSREHVSVIHETINDIDSNNKRIEFENNKYIYDLYEKNNDFTTLKSLNKRKIKEIDNKKEEQKYNMMKSFNSNF
tara:strand:- start:235 stop:507 length:273 start_codon:yes stop_codon:yes gene_type:complete